MTEITEPSFIALIPAAGIGSRMGAVIPKQYLPLQGKTVIEHTLDIFISHPKFQQIWVVLAKGDTHWQTLACASHPKIRTCVGGDSRMLSVYNGVKSISDVNSNQEWVLVHDAARCLLATEDLDQVLHNVRTRGVGTVLAKPMHETVKKMTDTPGVIKTVPRGALWTAQTPQVFRINNLLQSLSDVFSHGGTVTDESEAMELSGHQVNLLSAAHPNIKITRQDDLKIASALLSQQKENGNVM